MGVQATVRKKLTTTWKLPCLREAKCYGETGLIKYCIGARLWRLYSIWSNGIRP